MPDPTSTTARARSLRQSLTEAERRLWFRLRDRRLGGHKFVRQMPVGQYFADFGHRGARLLIEFDGSQHAESPYEDRRDRYLLDQSFRILRSWNHELSGDLTDVCETILAAIERRLEAHDRYKIP